MQVLRTILAWFRGGSLNLNDIEAALVSRVRDELSPNDADVIRQQVELVKPCFNDLSRAG